MEELQKIKHKINIFDYQRKSMNNNLQVMLTFHIFTISFFTGIVALGTIEPAIKFLIYSLFAFSIFFECLMFWLYYSIVAKFIFHESDDYTTPKEFLEIKFIYNYEALLFDYQYKFYLWIKYFILTMTAVILFSPLIHKLMVLFFNEIFFAQLVIIIIFVLSIAMLCFVGIFRTKLKKIKKILNDPIISVYSYQKD